MVFSYKHPVCWEFLSTQSAKFIPWPCLSAQISGLSSNVVSLGPPCHSTAGYDLIYSLRRWFLQLSGAIITYTACFHSVSTSPTRHQAPLGERTWIVMHLLTQKWVLGTLCKAKTNVSCGCPPGSHNLSRKLIWWSAHTENISETIAFL